MPTATWYINDRDGATFKGPGLRRKRDKTMTPTNAPETAKVQLTVFDLAKFDDVTLVKTVTLPGKPETLKAALEASGNDEAKLLELIHEGLKAEAKETARADMSGFMTIPEEEGEESVPYTGAYADEAKGKLINAGILALAKMNGYTKSLDPKKKSELKDNAKAFLRANPAMLGGLVPSAVPVVVEATAS